METKRKVATIIFAVLMCALVYSSFVQSMSMMALFVLAFLNFNESGDKVKVKWTWQPLQKLKNAPKYFHVLVISFYFLIVFYSFWQVTGDYNYYFERLRIKLPFLLIPIGYFGLPKLNRKTFEGLLYFFMVLMSVSALGVLLVYFANYEEVNLLIKKGGHMATPCSHIRFSLLVALAIIAGWYLIKEKYNRTKSINKALLILTSILVVSIQIISVKTGIICLYGALIVLILRHIYTTRSFKLGMSILVAMLLFPLIAYYTLPSFNKKVHYTMYDIQMYGEGKGSKYGDSGRITSLKVGWDIFTDSPLVGVGAGNLRSEVHKKFANDYPEYKKPLMPHSQFLFVLAGSGIIGFLFFMLAYLVPFFHHRSYQNDFYLGFYVIFFIAFLIEHTIENALGVGTFLTFILLCILYLYRDEEGQNTDAV